MTTLQNNDVAARINALPEVHKIVKNMRLHSKKSLGQHFLFDLNLTRKIARSVGVLTGTTIEIGPGPGGLTRALLLENAKHVIAIEKDRRISNVLSSLCAAAGDRLTLIEKDALESPIWNLGDAPRRIVANLPYNIASKLLVQWLEHSNEFESMTLMFQREVAERITAHTGDSAYGRLSILTRLYADARILFDVPASAFVPSPKIISSVVQIIPLASPRYPCPQHALEYITRIAFGQRRKMLRSSLKKINGERLLNEAKISPEIRPQDLDLKEFCKLANVYESIQKTVL